MKRIALGLIAAITIFATGCTKTGPQGPQGPTGNANVIGEDPFTVTVWSQNSGSNTWYANFSDGNFTDAVVNYGLVEIYKYWPGIGWTNLPDIDGVVSTVYNYGTNGFTISVLTTDGSATPHPGNTTFRVVVIPASLRQANPNANWKNYNETMRIMNEAKVTPVTYDVK